MALAKAREIAEHVKRWVDVVFVIALLVADVVLTAQYPQIMSLTVAVICLCLAYIALRAWPVVRERVPSWAYKYLRGNPGVPLIAAFNAMLVACSVLIALGDAARASVLALCALCALLIGFVLQLMAHFFGRGPLGSRA